MVKVQKVAAWKVGTMYIENADEAEKQTRRLVILELMEEQGGLQKPLEFDGSHDQVADWVIDNWDEVSRRTKAAMAGT